MVVATEVVTIDHFELQNLGNSNWRGAVILLGEGINKLRRYPDTYAGIDVDELLISSAAMLTALQAAGPEKIGDWILDNGGIALPEALQIPTIVLAVEES